MYSYSTTFLAQLFGKTGFFLLFCSSSARVATEESKTVIRNQFCQTNVRVKLLKNDPMHLDGLFPYEIDD
jgi:hypothetical protein